ncbi:PTS beta-glucoside transporter subunit EIIBCA [Erwinia sp. CPCC 100877]|nr:PTS beta-glucoside transporter subunit EIIBCA [Erwinia sp. CPCC 100877]
MNNSELSQEIVKGVGGKKNVVALRHCMTRLRFTVKNTEKIDEKLLEELPVFGFQVQGNECQVIIGNEVSNLYKEIINLYPAFSNDSAQDKKAETKGTIFHRLMENLSAILVDALPPIIGGGIIQGFRFTLMSLNVSDESNLMIMLTVMGSCALYFFPFLLASSTAKRIGTNQYMAMGLAACMMYPTIINGVDQAPLKLLGIFDMPFLDYSSSVIPIILAVLLMKYVYQFFETYTPAVVRIVFVPALTYLVMMPITLVLIAPLATYGGNYLAYAIEWLFDNIPWFAGAFIGATRPLLVLVGMHHAVRPIQAQQIATFGYTTINPINYISTMCQATAAFAAIFLTKNKQNKQIAISATISGFMGVTEPALYGIIFKYKGALIGTVIGGGVGGLISSMMGAKAFTFGVPNNFITMPVFMGGGAMSLLVGLVVGVLATAITTYLLGKTFFKMEDTVAFTDGKKEKKELESRYKNNDQKLKELAVNVPTAGELYSIEEVNDTTFSSKLLGEGFAVKPNTGKVFAPISGKVETLFHTKHAVGLTNELGVGVLVHAGIDTVKLNGKHFIAHCEQGQIVAKGELLLEMEIDQIEKENFDSTVITVVTDTGAFSESKISDSNHVNANDVGLVLKG